jgi:hypothetical protein
VSFFVYFVVGLGVPNTNDIYKGDTSEEEEGYDDLVKHVGGQTIEKKLAKRCSARR